MALMSYDHHCKDRSVIEVLKGYSFLPVFVVAFICLFTPALASETPGRTIIEAWPQNMEVDLQRNLLLFASGNTFYAYDLETGQARWAKPRTVKGQNFSVTFGADYAVMFCEQEFVVFDKETGHEVWRERPGRWRKIRGMRFEEQTNWVWQFSDNDRALYNLEEKRGYRVPLDSYLVAAGMTPDNKAVYGFKDPEGWQPPSRSEVFFWQIGARAPVRRYVIESPGRLFVRGVFENEFLISDYLYKREPEHIFRAYNADTGAITRVFDAAAVENMPPYFIWQSKDKRFLFWCEESKNLMRRMDIASGETVSAAYPLEHGVASRGTYDDAAGNWWFMTYDSVQNLWLFPFNHDAAPRKMLDGTRFLPTHTSNCTLSPPYLVTRNYGQSRRTRIYELNGMNKIADWPGLLDWNTPLKTVTTGAILGATEEYDKEDILQSSVTFLNRRDRETPLFKVKGKPLAISPDNRFVVIEESQPFYSSKPGSSWQDYEELKKSFPDEAPVHIIEVDSEQVVKRFEKSGGYAFAAFSPDSRFLALYYSYNLNLIDVEEGFSETLLFVPGQDKLSASSIQFSPNGERLLVSGYGQAYVFNVIERKHIATLTEKARFLNRFGGSAGSNMLYRAESRARDFLGRYTDRLKRIPILNGSYSQDGAHIITNAQNMLLRVWDAETGRLVRTINPKLPEQRNWHGEIKNTIVLSGDGAYALAYNNHGFDSGSLWDVKRGRKIRNYTFKGVNSVDAALSADGSVVYAFINGDLHFLTGAQRHN